jgi:hypothetical protein
MFHDAYCVLFLQESFFMNLQNGDSEAEQDLWTLDKEAIPYPKQCLEINEKKAD